MSNTMKNFGRNLYIALFDKKMSRKELAEKVGVSQQLISCYVSGDRSPSTETLIKIADALGVTVDSLIK